MYMSVRHVIIRRTSDARNQSENDEARVLNDSSSSRGCRPTDVPKWTRVKSGCCQCRRNRRDAWLSGDRGTLISLNTCVWVPTCPSANIPIRTSGHASLETHPWTHIPPMTTKGPKLGDAASLYVRCRIQNFADRSESRRSLPLSRRRLSRRLSRLVSPSHLGHSQSIRTVHRARQLELYAEPGMDA